ncbi:MAG TPA: hypothetical protein VIN58_01030 [Roseateles sp.]
MTQAQATLTAFVALLPIEHDGKRYAPGEAIQLGADQAAPLKAINAIALPSQRSTVSQVDLAAELRAANQRLDTQAEALGTASEAFEELKDQLAERDQALAQTTQELATLRADSAKQIEELQAQLAKAQSDLAAAGGAKAATKAGKA